MAAAAVAGITAIMDDLAAAAAVAAQVKPILPILGHLVALAPLDKAMQVVEVANARVAYIGVAVAVAALVKLAKMHLVYKVVKVVMGSRRPLLAKKHFTVVVVAATLPGMVLLGFMPWAVRAEEAAEETTIILFLQMTEYQIPEAVVAQIGEEMLLEELAVAVRA